MQRGRERRAAGERAETTVEAELKARGISGSAAQETMSEVQGQGGEGRVGVGDGSGGQWHGEEEKGLDGKEEGAKERSREPLEGQGTETGEKRQRYT